MKRLMIGMLLLASTSVFAAVATVQQIEPDQRFLRALLFLFGKRMVDDHEKFPLGT